MSAGTTLVAFEWQDPSFVRDACLDSMALTESCHVIEFFEGFVRDHMEKLLDAGDAAGLSTACRCLAACFRESLSKRKTRAIKSLCDRILTSESAGVVEIFDGRAREMNAQDCRLVTLLTCSSDVKDVQWHFHNCQLGDHRTSLLADGLKSAGRVVNLQHVSLTTNLIGNRGMLALSRAVASGSLDRLQVLSLSNNQISDDGLVEFGVSIASRSHASLSKLELSFNQIGDEGIIGLVDSLRFAGFNGLKHLGLSANRISDLGMSALATALSTKSVLTKLHVLGLSKNYFGDDGVTALCKALQEGACGDLQKLYLSGNRIGDSGIGIISDMVKVKSGLKFIYVAQSTSAEHIKHEISATCAAKNVHISV